jgi:predicted protein tyrosine phosphatase
MSAILITPFSAVEDTVRRHRPSHIVTLLDPQTAVTTPAGIARQRHLRLGVDDIAAPVEGSIVPTSDHIASILSFAETWDRSAPMLVHCWAGISRSTAAAFILLSTFMALAASTTSPVGCAHARPTRNPTNS